MLWNFSHFDFYAVSLEILFENRLDIALIDVGRGKELVSYSILPTMT